MDIGPPEVESGSKVCVPLPGTDCDRLWTRFEGGKCPETWIFKTLKLVLFSSIEEEQKIHANSVITQVRNYQKQQAENQIAIGGS